MEEMICLAMEHLDVAVTIIDNHGILLYYNEKAAEVLDRKPEYIGSDIRSHHKKTNSNTKIDMMLQAFKEGRREPFQYEAKPYGMPILVTLSPILRDEAFVGCTQSVQSLSSGEPVT